MQRTLMLIPPLLVMFACDRMWNDGNRSPLERDVRSLLLSCGLDPAPLKGGMAGTTREAWAAFPATDTHVQVLVRCLGLDPADEGSDLRRIASYKESEFSVQECVSVGAPGVEVWGTTRRIPLKSGSAFSYLILLYDHGSGRAGLRTAYASG